MSRNLTSLRALLCALVVAIVLPTGSADAASDPQIADTRVERAPIGKKGGLMNPVASCQSDSEPRVKTVVEGLDNDFAVTWKYRGALPGLYFPRLDVGRYRLTTQAWCGRDMAERAEVARIREKTDQTTVSRAEFRRIRVGMTPSQVTKIVGHHGYNSRYGSQLYRTYDMMPFWKYSSVEFRGGHVVRKQWNFGHD